MVEIELPLDLSYLNMAIEGSMMQARSAKSVGNVDVGEMRNDELGALDRIVCSRHVQRRLPVLVATAHICLVLQQDFNCSLKISMHAQLQK